MEISKETRISEEISRISILFEEIATNQRTIVTPLIQNAGFMKVTLEDLQAIINTEGVTDEYKNGANQYGVKQSATLQSYNALVKNYAAVIKTLSQLLPPEKKTVAPFSWTPREKTEEEIEADRKREEEELKRINAEIERAAEYQRQQRELEKAEKL